MSKTKIERLKRKFWEKYTMVWNGNHEAFELMREIGIAQGKLLEKRKNEN